MTSTPSSLSATGRTITSTSSSSTRRECPSPGSSIASRVCPRGGCVRGALKSEGVTSRARCGHPHTSPPHAVVRRSPSFVNTWCNNERTRLLPGLNAAVSGAEDTDEWGREPSAHADRGRRQRLLHEPWHLGNAFRCGLGQGSRHALRARTV